MANTLLTLDHIACEAWRILRYRCFPNREAIYCENTNGWRVGDTVMLRMPRPLDLTFDLLLEPIVEQTEAVTFVAKPDWTFPLGDFELLLSLDRFSERILLEKVLFFAREIEKVWPPGATLVTGSLPLPACVDDAVRCHDPESGLSLRAVRFYDVASGRMFCRFDMLCGFTNVMPALLPFDQERIAELEAFKAQLNTRLDRLRKAA